MTKRCDWRAIEARCNGATHFTRTGTTRGERQGNARAREGEHGALWRWTRARERGSLESDGRSEGSNEIDDDVTSVECRARARGVGWMLKIYFELDAREGLRWSRRSSRDVARTRGGVEVSSQRVAVSTQESNEG